MSDVLTQPKPAKAKVPHEGPTYVLTVSCPDRIGVVADVAAFLVANDCNIIESGQYSDQENGRFFLRNALPAAERRDAGEPEEGLRPGRRALRDRRPLLRRRAQGEDPAAGVAPGPLPERPDLPPPHRRPADRHRRRGLQPQGLRGPGRLGRPAVRLHAGHRRDQAAAGSPAAGPGREPRRRADRAGPLHAGAVGRVLRPLAGPGDQHPPLLPAELQGRPALPPGPRPRREADRRHRATTSPTTWTKGRSSSRTCSA